jgi:ferredoxin
MQDMHAGLRAFGVREKQIFVETIGPAALRRWSPDSPVVALPEASPLPVKDGFAKSRVEAIWEPGSGRLLDLAERVGLAPDFSCRSGSCGACRVPLVGGEVTYDARPTFDVTAGEALLCCSVPARSVSADGSRVVVDAKCKR